MRRPEPLSCAMVSPCPLNNSLGGGGVGRCLEADLAAAVKQIATEIKEKFDEAGMGKVEEFIDQIANIVDKAKECSGAVIRPAREQVEGIRRKLEDALADPKSLAPGGGLATCTASCYTKSVQTKLRAFADDTSVLVETMTRLAGNVQKPTKDLGQIYLHPTHPPLHPSTHPHTNTHRHLPPPGPGTGAQQCMSPPSTRRPMPPPPARPPVRPCQDQR